MPCLILLFEFAGIHPAEQVTVIAVATSLACIVFTSLSAAITQYRAGKVRWDLFRKLALFFILGSFAAGLLAPLLPAAVMRGIIGLFLIFVAWVMLSNWKPNPHGELPGGIKGAATGFTGGLMAGTAGIAGGNVIVPTLIYYNTPVHNATATSSALGVPIALAGAVSYAFLNEAGSTTTGYVDLAAFVIITLFAVAAAPFGVKLAHRVQADRLKRYFGILLIFVSARMLYTAATLA